MWSVAGIALVLPAMQAGVANLTPVKDNTLIEHVSGAVSNGAGPAFFAGRIGQGGRRRAVLAFKVGDSIPAGSTIQAVTLTLNMSATMAGPFGVSAHALTQDWGEGTSNAGGGVGAPSTPGDATWIHTFFSTSFWTSAGGDFAANASATTTVAGVGSYTWSSPGMVADVQGWLDDPSTDFGWILVGDESTFPTVKRFDSREAAASVRPNLKIDYGVPAPVVPTHSVAALLFLAGAMAVAGAALTRKRNLKAQE